MRTSERRKKEASFFFGGFFSIKKKQIGKKKPENWKKTKSRREKLYLLHQQLDVPQKPLPRVQLRHSCIADPLCRVSKRGDLREVSGRETQGDFHRGRGGSVFPGGGTSGDGQERRPRGTRRDDRGSFRVVLRRDAAEPGVIVGSSPGGDVAEAEGDPDGVEALKWGKGRERKERVK